MGEMVNGWQIARDLGRYGTKYLYRAAWTFFAVGGNLVEDACYPLALVDSEGKKLIGTNAYVLHFIKEQIPPVDAFWSLTMYDLDSYLVPNTIDRYALGDRRQAEVWRRRITHALPAAKSSRRQTRKATGCRRRPVVSRSPCDCTCRRSPSRTAPGSRPRWSVCTEVLVLERHAPQHRLKTLAVGSGPSSIGLRQYACWREERMRVPSPWQELLRTPAGRPLPNRKGSGDAALVSRPMRLAQACLEHLAGAGER